MPRGTLHQDIYLACTICGETFRAKTTGQKYCSAKCKNRAGGRLRKARNEQLIERRCYKCGETRAAAEFTSASKTYCTTCDKAYARRWRSRNAARMVVYKRRSIAKAAAADPDYYRRLTLRKFGLTLESFNALVDRYGGKCGICRCAEPGGKHDTWHIDHDHRCCPGKRSCGRCIRGILCSNCNLGLGHFKDDPEALRAAIAYLAQHA